MAEYKINKVVEEGDGDYSFTRHFYVNEELDVVLHNDDGPAVIVNHPAELKHTEYWYQHGSLHRTDGPAVVESVFDEVTGELKETNNTYMLNNRGVKDIEDVLRAYGVTKDNWEEKAAAYLDLEKKSNRNSI